MPNAKLSDAEWTVMQAVWEHSPASARDVLERIEGDTSWAYTTVKTMLARLVDKGALAERKRANTNLYEPLVTQRDARRRALRSLVERAFDGTFGSLMQHLIVEEKLSRKDRDKLTELLAEAEREKRKGR